MKRLRGSVLIIILLFTFTGTAWAQFEEPEIEKITHEYRHEFLKRFGDIKWTGQGLNRETTIDKVQTKELRARLQARYGSPTQKLEDLINRDDFRPGMAIQFEYWFTVDDSIPMMVLDIDGPFGQGLVFGGASRYIDLMPQIKRTFAEKLTSVDNLAEFQDYFYSPEREQWYDVRYENGEFLTREIEAPEGMKIEYDY